MNYFSFQRFKSEILKADGPPRVTAFSLALGIGLAFSPFPGLHLIISFVICKLMRLNGVLVIIGVLVHNPWTMLPIHFTGLVIGDLLCYGNLVSLSQFQIFPWHDLGLRTVFSSAFWSVNWPILHSILIPFFFGHLLMSSILGPLSYFLTLRLVRRRPEEERP